MRQIFSEIEVGNRVVFEIKNDTAEMEMLATIVRHLKENIAVIEFDDIQNQIIRFSNVKINMLYLNEKGLPYLWRGVTIVHYQGQYILSVNPDGGLRYNRRGSYRVGISQPAKIQISGRGTFHIIVKDISLTGFSITDRKNDLNLSNGDRLQLTYEDIGHELDLVGEVVRIEKELDYVIYGCLITKSCKDLPSYVNTKQRLRKK